MIFCQTPGWEQPKLARNEKISLSGNHSCRIAKLYIQSSLHSDCIFYAYVFGKQFNVQTDLAVTIANHNQDQSD